MQIATRESGDWWARPRGSAAGEWIANYQSSLQARHRTAIAAILRELNPASVLELGCHCGPNLIRLAEELPDAMLSGVDASAEAIAAGQRWAATVGVADRVEFTVGRIPQATEGLPDGCVDVVLTCYTLAYLSPSDLDAALYEIGRLASKAIVLAEPMTLDGGPVAEMRSLSGYSEWAHAYPQALRWSATVRDLACRVVPITPSVDRLNAVLVGERCSSASN